MTAEEESEERENLDADGERNADEAESVESNKGNKRRRGQSTHNDSRDPKRKCSEIQVVAGEAVQVDRRLSHEFFYVVPRPVSLAVGDIVAVTRTPGVADNVFWLGEVIGHQKKVNLKWMKVDDNSLWGYECEKGEKVDRSLILCKIKVGVWSTDVCMPKGLETELEYMYQN